MSVRSYITSITPLPREITRDAAVAQLHDHHAMIELNPLVLRHTWTDPPPNASADEAESGTWYLITDQINYLPGGAFKSEVSYKACFYDLPDGLQTHVFAPAGLDMKSKWTVGGNMPGEPKEPLELGVDKPREGLYIKEEVAIRCNIFLVSFVKRNLKKSHKVVVDKIVHRASDQLSASVTSPKDLNPTATNDLSDLSRSPTFLTRLRPLRSDTSAPNASSPQTNTIIHESYPRSCACEGVLHTTSCSLYQSDDLHSQGLSLSPTEQPTFDFDFDLTTESSSNDNDHVAGTQGPAVFGRPRPELYGSLPPEQCLCTGALHQVSCFAYPGLRIVPAPPQTMASNNNHNTDSQVSNITVHGHEGSVAV